MNWIQKPVKRNILSYFWREECFGVPYETIVFQKMKTSFFSKKWSLQFLENDDIIDGRNFLYLPNGNSDVGYYVGLLYMFLTGHWGQLTVIYWAKCRLRIFMIFWLHCFSRNGSPILWIRMGSYDHSYSNELSYFGIGLQETDLLSLCLKNLQRLALDHSTSSLPPANFFVVITLVYTELPAFSSRAGRLSLSL